MVEFQPGGGSAAFALARQAAARTHRGRSPEFFVAVGLPVHLGQLSIDPADRRAIDTVVEGALAFPFIHNMPGQVDAESLHAALLSAHELGSSIADRAGAAAYRRLQAA